MTTDRPADRWPTALDRACAVCGAELDPPPAELHDVACLACLDPWLSGWVLRRRAS